MRTALKKISGIAVLCILICLAAWQLLAEEPAKLSPEQLLRNPPTTAASFAADGSSGQPGLVQHLARTPDVTDRSSGEDESRVTGLVIDTAQRPLVGVAVRLSSEGVDPVATTSNADGCFAVGVDRDRTYLLEFTLDGMAPSRLRDVCSGNHYCVVLTRSASVSGVVLEANQQLAAEALVSLSRLSPPAESLGRSTTTQGKYSFGNLAAGRYALVVDTRMHLRHYKSFTLASGEERIEDLRLSLSETPLSGRVVDDRSSAPIGGASVSLSANERDAFVHTDIDGTFVLHSPPPGRHMVHVRAEGYARSVLLVQCKSGEPTPPVEVRLSRGLTLNGRVTSSGESVAGALVGLRATRELDNGATWDFDYRCTADGSGSFSIEHVPHGSRCVLRADGGTRGATVMDLGVRLDSDSEFVQVELQKLLALRGTLVDAAPTGTIAGTVIIETESPELGWSRASVSIPGHFVARVPDRTPFRLVATTEDGREVVQRFAPTGDRTMDVVVRFDEGLSISGSVSGELGEPVDAIVAVGDGQEVHRVVESSGGRFTVPGLPARAFTVIAWQRSKGRGAFGARANNVMPGRQDLNLVLPALVAASGRLVEGPSRGPVVGARVWCYFLADGMAACEPVTTSTDGGFALELPNGERLGIRVSTRDRQADVGAIVTAKDMAPVEVELPPQAGSGGK